LSKEDIAKLESIQEEHGILPTGESINDIKAIHLINKIVKRSKENERD